MQLISTPDFGFLADCEAEEMLTWLAPHAVIFRGTASQHPTTQYVQSTEKWAATPGRRIVQICAFAPRNAGKPAGLSRFFFSHANIGRSSALPPFPSTSKSGDALQIPEG